MRKTSGARWYVVQTLYEHILKIYCGVECGLEDYQKVENSPDIGDNTL